MDTIKIKGIRAYGYTGFLPEEQALGQWFSVDVTLWLDLRPAGNSDHLDDTIDYRQVIDSVKGYIQNQKYSLVEKLTEVIATAILAFPQVTQVRVELSKEAPPIPDFSGQITIDITRN